MKRFFIFLAIILFWALPANADVLYLKNGQKVTGKILQETGFSFKMDVGGTTTTYYLNEVQKVLKGDEPPPAAPVPSAQVGVPAVTPEVAPAPVEVSAATEQLILRLLDANGSKAYMTNLFAQILREASDKERESLKGILKVDEVLKRIVPIYARYYTEDELKQIVDFYNSPAGVKHVQNTPKIMEETLREVTKYFQEKSPAAQPAPTK